MKVKQIAGTNDSIFIVNDKGELYAAQRAARGTWAWKLVPMPEDTVAPTTPRKSPDVNKPAKVSSPAGEKPSAEG